MTKTDNLLSKDKKSKEILLSFKVDFEGISLKRLIL